MRDEAKPTISLYLVVILGSLFVLSQVSKYFKVTDNEHTSISKIIETSTSKEETYEGNIPAVEYKFQNNKNYNQIVTFEKNGIKTFAFRMETDTEVGNGGYNFNYEIGRIMFDINDRTKSACTFNFRTTADGNKFKWFDNCSESKFLTNLNDAAELKRKEYDIIKPMYEELGLIDVCGMAGSEDDSVCKKYSKMSDKEFTEYFNNLEKRKRKQLAKLRNITIEALK